MIRNKYRTKYEIAMEVLQLCVEPTRPCHAIVGLDSKRKHESFLPLLTKGFLVELTERRKKRVINRFSTEHGKFYQTSPSGITVLNQWKIFQKLWNGSVKPLKEDYS